MGTVAIAAHVFYELFSGVGMPFASFVGRAPAAMGWAAGSLWLFRAAQQRPRSADRMFAVVNGPQSSRISPRGRYSGALVCRCSRNARVCEAG
jgi:hypothetical protein